ncbi:MAG TPA: GGDEF domain-containing protein, partial [Pseudomonadales bacterium]|nr:GGDEF domain-containing protein [Pseudomonadales bacterium]
ERIGRFQSFDLSAENNRVVMTDERNNVLFASPGLGLSVMDNFGLTRAGGRDLFIDSDGNDYSYAAQEISEGWKVFVLHKTSIALANVLQHFISLFITLGFITVAAVLVSARFAISLSVPITRLVENIRDGKASDATPESLDVDEIHALYHSYYDNKRRIEYQQQYLEEQVYRRSMDLLEANNKLSRQAYTDGLTGLDNVRAMSERFSQLRSLAHRNNGRLLVLHIDIDYLSRINDTYGHDKGDQCIKSLGEVLRHCFQRDYDILARLGSDEFVVITQVFDWDVLSNYIDVCRLKIESSALPIGAGRNVNVTVSMGGFVAEAGWSQYYEDWLQIASQTMQSAKQQGRNCLLTREDNPRNKIAVPSVALASRDIEQHQGVFIEPLHDGLLNARFEHLRSSLSRSGGALMVAKFALHSHDADDVGLQRGCCRDLLQIFRRGYDTVAMLDEQQCLVVTAVTHREEAERLIERALYHLLKQQPAIESQLMAGAVLAEATWHSDFNEWLSVCDTKLTEIEPDTLRRFKLMCLTGRVY